MATVSGRLGRRTAPPTARCLLTTARRRRHHEAHLAVVKHWQLRPVRAQATSRPPVMRPPYLRGRRLPNGSPPSLVFAMTPLVTTVRRPTAPTARRRRALSPPPRTVSSER
uniref:Uncharacterized protein n=1 Tax=Plectus sambesii TaxID=2011161 RepID=A0A914UGW2_9BILA